MSFSPSSSSFFYKTLLISFFFSYLLHFFVFSLFSVHTFSLLSSKNRSGTHDDHPLSRYACPPITTVAQNYNEIGKLAIEMLLNKLSEAIDTSASTVAEERILLSAELMLRNSA